jgi:dolichyl-phosphate beta-glucosyltransferase
MTTTMQQDAAQIDHDLTMIVPAYNEEARLPKTLDELARLFDTWQIDYRVLVVDDGSTDRTAQIVAGRGARFNVLRQPQSGKGAAVRNGVLHATGRAVAFTDADLPFDLSCIRESLVAISLGRCDVVFGARDLHNSMHLAPRRMARTLATWTFRRIVSLLVSGGVTDTQCGLKLFSHRAARDIFSRATIDGFAFDAEIVYLTQRLGYSFVRIPVTLINEYSSTISLSRHALPMLLDVLRLRLRAWQGGYDSPPPQVPAPAEPTADQRPKAAA